jgi:hypothetical protein
MTYVDRIIDQFGGLRSMAATGGWPVTTVQYWKQEGLIPARRQQEVMDVGRANGIPLEPSDFFDLQTDPAA